MKGLREALALVLAAPALAFVPSAAHAQDEPAAALPDWSGIWVYDGPEYGINGFSTDPAASPLMLVHSGVPWNAVGQRVRDAAFASMMAGQGKADGWGYPLMMGGPPPLQFVVTPGETIILNTYRDLRHIYTDGRGHLDPEVRWDTVWGDSVGHWEGDTLVIETVAVAEPPRYFFGNQPFSANAVYVERIRRVAPDRIENQLTVTDPERLAHPWTITLAYVPAPYVDRLIHDAYTNDRSELDEGGLFTILPPQDQASGN